MVHENRDHQEFRPDTVMGAMPSTGAGGMVGAADGSCQLGLLGRGGGCPTSRPGRRGGERRSRGAGSCQGRRQTWSLLGGQLNHSN